jgi:hypothetical protein
VIGGFEKTERCEMGLEYYGREICVAVGSVIEPDEWVCGMALEASDWEGATYRLESCRYPGVSSAVNVTISGRTVVRRAGNNVVRVRIEWVEDGEESSYSGGYMRV